LIRERAQQPIASSGDKSVVKIPLYILESAFWLRGWCAWRRSAIERGIINPRYKAFIPTDPVFVSINVSATSQECDARESKY
jgi:hypothetical protein